MDSTLDITIGNHTVAITKKYMAKDLKIIQEAEFNNTVLIFHMPDRYAMYKYFGNKDLHSIQKYEGNPASYSVTFVQDTNHCPLNLGLMKAIASAKWGGITDSQLTWLEEGLASYATPEAYSCDGHNFMERYANFSGRKKLVNILQFPQKEEKLKYKIACNQAAYVVEYLLKQEGIDKLKELWQGRMTDFEKIYGITFGDLTEKINKELIGRDLIFAPFNWYGFNKDCIDPQPDGWFPAYNPPKYYSSEFDKMVTLEAGNLKFTVYSTTSLSERKDLINKAYQYIIRGLELIDELPFNDSIHVVLFPKREDMKNFLGIGIGGVAELKDYGSINENTIYAVYDALGHELMHMVAHFKWGDPPPQWLDEGLATLACPEAEGCDGHTFEERYIYLLQTDKLIQPDTLITSLHTGNGGYIESKISYNQSAYLVGYLLDNYGTEKLKHLWQNGMREFETIYGIAFESLMVKINKELSEKYPSPIEFNWELFKQSCME